MLLCRSHTTIWVRQHELANIYLSYEGCFKVVQADKGLYDYRLPQAIDATEYKWQHFEDVKPQTNVTVPLKFRLKDKHSNRLTK